MECRCATRVRIGSGWLALTAGKGHRHRDGLDLLHESITQTDNRLDLRARNAKLGAKPAHMDVHRAGFDEPLVAPDALEQAVPRQDAVPVVNEEPKQLEFAAREANGLSLDFDRDGIEIRTQVFALIDGGSLRGSLTAKNGSNAG